VTLDDRIAAAAPLADEALAEIATHGVVREYAPRTVLVSEGEVSDTLFIILEGKLRAYVSDENGREAMLSTMGPGEYFGEIALDAGPRSASVVTLERCRLVVVPIAELEAFLARHPQFARHFIHRLIQRIRSLTETVRKLSLMDAYGRIRHLLLEEAVTRDGERFVPQRLTQSDIASRVGCSREMVSRIFKDLVAGGCIALEADRIVIRRDPPARW
jgi:CRP/FNR family cyclic AMP-dependent transcriptional regulator